MSARMLGRVCADASATARTQGRVRADASLFTPGNFITDATVRLSHGWSSGHRPSVHPSVRYRPRDNPALWATAMRGSCWTWKNKIKYIFLKHFNPTKAAAWPSLTTSYTWVPLTLNFFFEYIYISWSISIRPRLQHSRRRCPWRLCYSLGEIEMFQELLLFLFFSKKISRSAGPTNSHCWRQLCLRPARFEMFEGKKIKKYDFYFI
jgi:hypothetical protein